VKKIYHSLIGLLIGIIITTAIIVPIEQYRIKNVNTKVNFFDLVIFSANTTNENLNNLHADTIDRDGYHWGILYFTVGRQIYRKF